MAEPLQAGREKSLKKRKSQGKPANNDLASPQDRADQ